MQNMVPKLLLIAALVGLCLWSILSGDLRLGKDLRGGVSLIYKVNLPEDTTDPQAVLAQTTTVLKERVNPTGVMDISMLPIGRDRIEVVMPLPNEEVRALAEAFDDALMDLLRQSEIRATVLDAALRGGTAVQTLGGDTTSDRGQLVESLQAAYDTQRAARQAYEDAVARGVEGAELRGLALDRADAESAYDEQRDAVLRLSLGEMTMRRTLGLDQEPQAMKGEDGKRLKDDDGNVVLGPSKREEAINRLKAEYSQLAGAIDATIAAFDTYRDRRTGFDDPEDLIRMLRGAGELEFRIAVEAQRTLGVDVDDLRRQLAEVGADAAASPLARWFKINQLKQWYDSDEELAAIEADPVGFFSARRNLVAGERDGEYYLLLFTNATNSMTHEGDSRWSIEKAYRTVDSLGRPAVGFELNQSGAIKMSQLTSNHLQEPMAIVIDGEVFSAPNINSTISRSGIIQGTFSDQELSYLIRVLAAGSLSARLSPNPIAINTLGPSIGADNLGRGLTAFKFALVAVAIFMLAYYFFAGFVADLALAINGIMIFGLMMLIDGTFTLPGLAGIVLTIGMAVDANVLIYERIREELMDEDQELKVAIREGYRKAVSTILDANITNLIVCFVLFKTATTEVKGFALTLTIGICATLFTTLFVTRQVYHLYTDVARRRKLSMLPTVFPAVHRALEPAIDWLSLRKIFWCMSAVALIVSIGLVMSRGVNMFDTEFRGGISLTMATATIDDDGDGEPDLNENGEVVRTRLRHSGDDGVEARIKRLGDVADPAGAADDAERDRLLILRELANAQVLTAGDVVRDDQNGILAERFQVKVASPKGLGDDATNRDIIVTTLIAEFGDELDVTRPLGFEGAGEMNPAGFVFEVRDDEIGKNINRPEVTDRLPEFLGGVAILLRNVDPPTSPEDVEQRIDRMRNQQDFQQYSGRDVRVLGLTRAEGRADRFSEFAVLVYDPYKNLLGGTDSEVWYADVATAEWRLLNAALQRQTSFEQVSTFSSAVAETLSANAIVAVVLSLLGILVYIWIRFGSLRYSMAAIAALVHDVTIALGLLALSGYVGVTGIGNALLIEPFRIDLGVVAALLTIIGYSLNDTIVILDRIRENRGKMPLASASTINKSINQTVSRTVLTSVTTLLAVGIMYAAGGSGIRPFAFCLLAGLVVGTYSSVAIAAPLTLRHGGGAATPATTGRSAETDTSLETAVTT
jgi:SecD/SecF fusion protein